MFRNRLYYSLKPLVPWRIRMGLRRWFAVRKRKQVERTWPILPGSEKPPANWPGWPDGKQFAFVLTHDVEGLDGLYKVRRLAELEMSLGFRSCFNFIPEGDYRVPPELLGWLVGHGFEVGVHDLYHDGTLHRSRADFFRQADRINHHLRSWNAVGFRAGFMRHNLDWQHALDVRYDCSTFDTDPFEPQPDGVGTIFPFWVPAPADQKSEIRSQKSDPTSEPQLSAFRAQPSTLNPQTAESRVSRITHHASRPGYAELPYTLPQDSTLFLLLRENSPDVWLRKLDWVARHGGMALVNVHPDYVRFDGEAPSARTFPIKFYAELLQHYRERYTGAGWLVLPKDVAAHVPPRVPPPVQRRPLRVCMVTHSHYSRDNRVIRYAEALAARGDQVDVLGLSPSPAAPREECINGVNVIRLQERFGKNEETEFGHLFPVLRFFFKASVRITRHSGRRNYDLCHIHNIPDFLVFVVWYPRLRGAKIILDIHDIVPEFYASKFAKPTDSWKIRGLLLMERWSARFAHHVIIANHLWLEKYARRSAAPEKCSVFINNVDTALFRRQQRTRDDGRLIIMFPGGLQWHQGLDIGLRAFRQITDEFSNAEFHIYGDGNMKSQLVSLAGELGLNGKVKFFEPRALHEMAKIMANADLGVVPKRADSFGNEAYSTKIMEFMALGVPVVVSETRIDRHYFNDSVVRFFESGNPEAMAAAMSETLRDRLKRQEMVACAQKYAREHGWDSRKADYLKLVDDLCSPCDA